MSFWRRRPDYETLDRIERLERGLRLLIDNVDSIDGQLVKVKGLIYAKKIHKTGLPGATEEAQDGQSVDTRAMTRQELKAYLTRSGRFQPGKPPVHSE